MPRYSLPIEEIDESIRRPIVSTVITDVMQLFGIDASLSLLFKGDAPQHNYQNSEMNGTQQRGNIRFQGDGILTITGYEDELNETTLLSTPIDYPDSQGVFFDDALRVYLVPVRISRKYTVSLQLTGTEKNIERWGAVINRRTKQGLLNGIHNVRYHYPIPTPFLGLLAEIHQRKEAVAPYNETLGEWFKECFIPTMTVLRDPAGNNPIFVIQEAQSPIQGWFDFGTGVPRKEKDNDSGRYALNFTYTFYVDTPETITMMTPLVIHNQLIPPEWFPTPKPMSEIDYIKKAGSYSQVAFDHWRFKEFGADYTWSASQPGLSIPPFNDWLADEQPTGYGGILRLLTKLDPCNLNKIHNLDDLGEWAIHPLCKNYMKDTRQHLTSRDNSVINIQLYEYSDLLDKATTQITEDLDVMYITPADMRKMYHCVVGMLYDPRRLTDAAREDLGRHACFFKLWICTLYPGADRHFGWDMDTCSIGSDGDTMTPPEIDEVIDIVTKTPTIKPLWALVGLFAIHVAPLEN